MLEHSIYSVISPEGCASILWKDAEKMREAAEALRLTAQDLQEAGRDRPDHPGAAGRRAARPGGHDRGGRQGDRGDAEGADGQEAASALVKDRRQKFLDMGSKGLAA